MSPTWIDHTFGELSTLSVSKWQIVLAAIGLITVLRVVYCLFLHPYSDIPGPILAKISPFWKVRGAIRGSFYKDITASHRKYGKIFRVAPDEVSISDPDAIKQIYAHGSKFIKTDFYTTWKNMNKESMFSYIDEKEHAAERRLVATAYSLTSLLQLEPFVNQLIVQFTTRLAEYSGSKTPIDMVFWLHAFAFDVVGELGFGQAFGFLASGTDVNGQMARSREWLRQRFAVSMVPWFFPIWRHPIFNLFSPSGREEEENEKQRNEFSQRAVRSRMSRPVDRRDMLGRFLDAKHPSGNPLSTEEVLEQAMVVVAAGSDSTAIALGGVLSFILKTPGVCAKVVQEIEEFAARGEISDPITYNECQKLPYFCACVKEALRLHSPVGYLLPRRVPEQGATIAGRFFAPGSIVGMNPWTVHRDEAIFGADPLEFKPERWMESDERNRFMEHYNLTFGQGGRICIGKNIALMEIHKVLPTILRHFEFQLAEPEREWKLDCHFFVKQDRLKCYMKSR